MTTLVDGHSFTVLAARIVKHEVEKRSRDKAKMEERFVKLAEAVEEKKIQMINGILTKRFDPSRFASPSTDISEDKKTKPKAYSNSKS